MKKNNYLLIYCYFKEYAVKDKEPQKKVYFEEKFEEKFREELRSVKEDIKKMDKDEKYNNYKVKMKFLEKYIADLENMTGEPTKKIKTLLSMIKWDKEKITGEWTVKNIYNHNRENELINLFKLLCKSVIV